MGNKAATPLPAYESISRRFSTKELERIKDTFSSMSKNVDGTPAVSRDAFLNKHGDGLGWAGLRVLARLFRVLDTNISGALEADEYVAAIFFFTKASRAERLKVLLSMYDTGGASMWAKSELVLFCCEATMAVTERQMQLASETKAEGMEFVDGNGTPYRELSAMMADLVLIKHDVDRDGKLSLTELSQYAQQADSHFDDVLELLCNVAPATRTLAESFNTSAPAPSQPQAAATRVAA